MTSFYVTIVMHLRSYSSGGTTKFWTWTWTCLFCYISWHFIPSFHVFSNIFTYLEENNVAISMYEIANLWVFVPPNKLHRYIF